MTTTDRIREALDAALKRSPIVIMRRRTLLARENNAFMLGADFGAVTGQSSEALRRPRLEVVS